MSEYNNYQQYEGGELSEGMTTSAADLGDYDKNFTLLPEGDYNFTVVNLESSRYQPGPDSSGKTGPCKQITLTLRVKNPENGEDADLKHNLYMWNSRQHIGKIAQFYDSVGLHKKGEPITYDWRPQIIIGKTGRLALNHRVNSKDADKPKEDQRIYNNIKKLYPKETAPAQPTGGWKPGNF